MLKKIVQYLLANIRYLVAALLLLVVGLVNVYSQAHPTVDSKQENKCKVKPSRENAVLSKTRSIYSLEGVINSQKNEYYRLILNAKSDKNVEVNFKLAGVDSGASIKNLTLPKSDSYAFYDFVFEAPGRYSDLILQKNNANSATVYMKDIRVERLNVSSLAEVPTLKASIFGWPITNKYLLQTEDDTKKFSQLSKKNVLLGQSFVAESEFLDAVNLDVTREGTGGDGEYKLQLYKLEDLADKSGAVKPPIAEAQFSACEMEKYRQDAGDFRIPFAAELQKGEKYFIGINNEDVVTSPINFLSVRGSAKDALYEQGTALAFSSQSRKPLAEEVKGDIYLALSGGAFVFQNGQKLSPGAIIEDLGSGQGKFIFASNGEPTDSLNLEEHSADVEYNYDKGTIVGKKEGESHFTYVFHTLYPIDKFHFLATQPATWSKVRVSYSFDQKNWTDVPFQENGKAQYFDAVLNGGSQSTQLYLSVTYDPDDQSDNDLYGLREMKIEALLKNN